MASTQGVAEEARLMGGRANPTARISSVSRLTLARSTVADFRCIFPP